MNDLVRLDRDGGIVVVSLDDPHRRNPLSRAMLAQLDAALQAAETDEATRAVVLRGEGPAFCAGLDLREAADADMRSAMQALIALQARIIRLAVPVVARVHGPARAAALGVLAAADIVLAADHVDFSFPEVRLGVVPAAISATLVPRLDQRAASELMLTARAFSAGDAARIGLLTRAVPASDLDAAVTEACADIVAADRQAVGAVKRLLGRPLAEALDRDGEALAALSAEFFTRRFVTAKE